MVNSETICLYVIGIYNFIYLKKLIFNFAILFTANDKIRHWLNYNLIIAHDKAQDYQCFGQKLDESHLT